MQVPKMVWIAITASILLAGIGIFGLSQNPTFGLAQTGPEITGNIVLHDGANFFVGPSSTANVGWGGMSTLTLPGTASCTVNLVACGALAITSSGRMPEVPTFYRYNNSGWFPGTQAGVSTKGGYQFVQVPGVIVPPTYNDTSFGFGTTCIASHYTALPPENYFILLSQPVIIGVNSVAPAGSNEPVQFIGDSTAQKITYLAASYTCT